MSLKSLRQRVAQALYDEPPSYTHHVPVDRIPWERLDAERQAAWLNDADRVIPIVVEACVRVVTQTDPEKPANFLFRREQLGNVLTGLFIGAHDDEWQCPIGNEDCTEDCGSYGCGN